MPNKVTATYSRVAGKMKHDGYFIYGNNTPLKWVAIENVEVV